jgi:hypothetical protein
MVAVPPTLALFVIVAAFIVARPPIVAVVVMLAAFIVPVPVIVALPVIVATPPACAMMESPMAPALVHTGNVPGVPLPASVASQPLEVPVPLVFVQIAPLVVWMNVSQTLPTREPLGAALPLVMTHGPVFSVTRSARTVCAATGAARSSRSRSSRRDLVIANTRCR